MASGIVAEGTSNSPSTSRRDDAESHSPSPYRLATRPARRQTVFEPADLGPGAGHSDAKVRRIRAGLCYNRVRVRHVWRTAT